MLIDSTRIENFPWRHQIIDISKSINLNMSMKRLDYEKSKANPILVRQLTSKSSNKQVHGMCDNLQKRLFLDRFLRQSEDLKSCQQDKNVEAIQGPVTELSSEIAPQELDFHHLIFTLSKISFEVKRTNENLTQLNLFVVCVLLSVISTTINDLLLGDRKHTAVVLGYSIFCGASNTFLFVYFVLKASNVLEEYSRTKTEILNKVIGNLCVFGAFSKRMDTSCFLMFMKRMSPHFIISCMGLFDFHKSIILTTFGCAVTYGVILMQMK